jgi:phosphomannomutase
MSSVSLAVLSAGADLGLIFDTDVDRSAAVDHCGLEISRNRIVALAAALVAADHPGATVVTDSITSNHLTDFIERKLGLKHLRFQRGYKNVINKALALNTAGIDCPLAIETSGHAALRENYFLDDGAYLATKIVVKAALLHREGQRLEELLEGLADPAEEREVRMKLTCPDFGPYGDGVLADFAAWAKTAPGVVLVEPNYEGVRLDFYEEGQAQSPEAYIGWCLLRKSLHDPLMPLNLEADQPGGCMAMAGRLREFLAAYDCLDSSAL